MHIFREDMTVNGAGKLEESCGMTGGGFLLRYVSVSAYGFLSHIYNSSCFQGDCTT